MALALRSHGIMFKNLFTGLILVAAADIAGAQSVPAPTPPIASPAKQAITLIGCVQSDSAKPGWFTLSDRNTGTTYRLTGANVKAYVWRNVRIVGGLVPSPNIAAQAGRLTRRRPPWHTRARIHPEPGTSACSSSMSRACGG
jgi:hypothetical protein